MTKTIDEIKAIWKKSFIEAASSSFDVVNSTAVEMCAKSEVNPNKVKAAMSNFQAAMEKKLKENGILEEDIQIIKDHSNEWVMESINWVTDLIMDKTKMKEKVVTVGGKHD